jgi:hypothetical protein
MDAEMKARELLAAECGRSVEEMHYEAYGVTSTAACIRAIRRALEQPEEESRAITALKVTLFGVECWLPSGIAKAVQAACEQPASAAGDAWHPIATAPEDGIHIRGLWVTNKFRDGTTAREWRQYVGLIEDETGRFVDPEYMEDFGWEAGHFDAWMSLPEPPAAAPTPEASPHD